MNDKECATATYEVHAPCDTPYVIHVWQDGDASVKPLLESTVSYDFPDEDQALDAVESGLVTNPDWQIDQMAWGLRA